MNSKARILAKGSLIKIIYFFSTVAAGLYLMPLMIHSFGKELYGLWMFIFSLLGFYLIFDMGLASATQRYVSQAIGRNNKEEANAIVNTTFFLFSAIGIMIFIIVLSTAYLLPLFLKNISNLHLFKIVLLILGANSALSVPMRIFSGILISHLRFDIQTGVELFKTLLKTVLVIIFLKLNCGVIIISLVFCFSDLLGYFICYLYVKKIAPYITFSLRFFKKDRLKELYSYSWKTFVTQIGDQLRFNIDNLVITYFMGLSFVTLYSIASRLIYHFINFIWSSVGLMAPIFSQYESIGDYESIREKFVFTTKITGYLTIIIGGTLIIFGRAFIERWVGTDYLSSYPILLILSIAIISDLVLVQTVGLLYGISKHGFLAIINSIEGISNLILSILLVKKYGLIGVALGTAIPMLIIKIFVQPVYVCKVINFDVYKFYSNILLPVLLKSGIILFIFYSIFRSIIKPNYLSIISLASLNLLLFIAIIIAIGFEKNERNYFKKIIVKQ